MREETRTRAALVVGLVAAGALLGVAGTALGVGGPVADDPAAEFVVADGVSVESGGERATVVSNATEYEAVEIEREGDGFTVRATEADALNASQRERARAVARGNQTVAAHLSSLDDYELAVEPVAVLNASTAVSVDVEAANGSGDTITGTTSNVSVETAGDDAVTVERDRSYADDLATVEVRRPGGREREFVAHVDLANETVTWVVDRTEDGRSG
ncbi:hypothetical protein [Halobacterium yunchengense]|uniref:hypothetical protein n=1 Tax=Halobacterium yunchengense TaxID=3108497 RepID=UPI003009207E